ncbi:porin family protein [Limimaricola sp.]|uniref:outer membrane protein n=1 Tax=Limimaricola sp. TaxID=2211665 RepID=UPI0025C2E7D6|nr:porin family protein [Limimaricola sp.]
MAKTRFILAAALPALLAAPAAFAGGMAPIVAPPAPVEPVPVMAPPSDWSGFYIGADVGTATASSAFFPADISGTVYGIHAGYMYDMGSIVLAGEGFYGQTQISESGINVDSASILKLKLGYDAGSVMPYVVAGYGNYTVSGGYAATDNGTVYGAGANIRITDRIFANAEFLQHKITNFDSTGVDVDATSVSAGVSFKF